MRKIILCVLAVLLWSQAVDALVCYHCPNGGPNCDTATCASEQDQCMTMWFTGIGSLPKYGKRCSSQYECQLLNSVPQSGVSAICCGFDRCNR
ncbi:putative Three finger toxin protein [Naja naja]|uniref:Snake toxin/toxin-like domain-containing protein n=1 Tax=Naja naja TaxID=35670 RepID=A0A8C6Y153_NAJNA|nr:putative Three finger toxin protein [Naja naja]